MIAGPANTRPRTLPWRTILIVASSLVVAATFRPVIEGDGVGYYSYLHAAFVSHSLDFQSEYSAAVAAGVPLYRPLIETHTVSGRLANFFPVGSAILAAPAYLVALAMHPSGEPQYGTPFVEAFSLASLFFGLVAMAVWFRLARRATQDARGAMTGVIVAALASPFAFYTLSEPSYSHTFSIFCVSLFLYAWWVGPPAGARGWFGLGVLGGVMAATRFQEGLLLAIVLIDLRRMRWPALMLIPGALIAFAPQLVNDQIQFGTLLPQRPPGQALDVIHGQYLAALFSSRDGLFVWTPAAFIAAVGIGFFVPDRRLQLACLLAFIGEAAIIGAAPDTPGRAFGARRFLDLMPIVAIGLAAVAARVGPRIAWTGGAVLIAWNVALQANFVYVMRSSPGLDYASLLAGQLQAIPDVPRLLAKGAVVRDLVLWRQAQGRFDAVHGIVLALLEVAIVLVAVGIGDMRWRRDATLTATPAGLYI